MVQPTAMILVGGRSQRFGENKALVSIEGRPLILRLRDELVSAGHRVNFIADRADRYAELGLECLVDAQADSGPLAGLATALTHQALALQQSKLTESSWVLLVNCDQVTWRGQWSRRLMEATASRASEPASPWAVMFASSRWQPLPGLYHVDLLEEVRERLDQRRLSLHGLLDSCQAKGRCVSIADDDPPSQWTFNTREEFDRLIVSRNHWDRS